MEKEMTLKECMEIRFSCRDFKNERIKKEELEAILNATSLAPTAVNLQPQKIFVLQNEELLQQLREVAKGAFNAPTVLVVCHDKNISWHRKRDNKDHGIIDSSIVATYMMLKATSLNIGCTYVCAFNDEAIRNLLNIPENLEINCLLPIGYPMEINQPREKKSYKEFTTYID